MNQSEKPAITDLTPARAEELQEILRYLGRRAKARPSDKLDWVPKFEDLDDALLTHWGTAMKRLVGEDLYRFQEKCGNERRHGRGTICEECGYSDNLYLEELQRILRRKTAQKNATAAAKAAAASAAKQAAEAAEVAEGGATEA